MKGNPVRRNALLAALLALLVGGLSPLAADDGLTLAQTRTLALAQSRTLQIALAAVDTATIDERLQGFKLLPSISTTASAKAGVPWTSLQDSLNASLGVSVTQVLFDGGASVLSAIDSIATSAARAQARSQYFAVLDTADATYYAAAKASAAVEAAQSDLDSALASQAVAQAKLDAHMISAVAFLEQQATVVSKQAALVGAQGALSVALRTLASLTGLSLPLTLAPMEGATSADAVMQRFTALSDAQVDSLVAKIAEAAAKSNPSIAEAQLASQIAQKTVDYARAAYLPSVSASLNGGLGVSGGLSGTLAITASLPLDLWNTQATVESRQIAARQAALKLAETQRTATISIQQAVYDSISSARSASSSQAALDYAERFYQGVQEQYRLSTASSADLADAALLVSTNRATRISSYYQFLGNLSTLRSLAGFESDELLLALVP